MNLEIIINILQFAALFVLVIMLTRVSISFNLKQDRQNNDIIK